MLINRLSDDAKHMLFRSGWFPGRDVSSQVAKWEAELGAHAYRSFPMAREVLNELGGLLIEQNPKPDNMSGLLPVAFTPTIVLEAGSNSWMIRELFDALAQQAGVAVYPIGEFVDSHYYMAVSDEGTVFALLDYAQVIGSNLSEALENIHAGRQPHEIAFPL